MRNFSSHTRSFLLVIAILSVFTSTALSQTTSDRLQAIISDYIQQHGDKVQVVGVGSWISNKGYLDPLQPGGTSDHDIRVIVSGLDDTSATKEWRYCQEYISTRIKKEFGNKAKAVLSKVNIYPPDQLMAGMDVENEADAVSRFQSLGASPNLGGEPVEGLWGKGAIPYRQGYEAKSGRLFYKDGNVVRNGLTDLTHLSEGSGRFSLAGSANTADQWIDKADHALASINKLEGQATGNAKDLYKYIGRLRDDITKGRSLARAAPDDYLATLAARLQAAGRGSPDAAQAMDYKKLEDILYNDSQLREDIRTALQRARFETAVLKNLAETTDPRQVTALYDLLEAASGKWSRFKAAAGSLAAKIPWDISLHALTAFCAAYAAGEAGKALAADSWEPFVEKIYVDVGAAALAGAGTGMLASVAAGLLEDAKALGWDLSVQSQDCQDLLAGIYEVKGREQVSDSQRLERSVDQLATQFADKAQVQALVQLHAREAAKRDGKEADAQIEDRLVQKCSPEIVNRWQRRRETLLGEAARAMDSLETRMANTRLVLTVQPQNATLEKQKGQSEDATITAQGQAVGDASALKSALDAIAPAIAALGGKNHEAYLSVTRTYLWTASTPTSRGPQTRTLAREESLYTGNGAIIEPERLKRILHLVEPGETTVALRFELTIRLVSSLDDVHAARRLFDKDLAIAAAAEVSIAKAAGSQPDPLPPTAQLPKQSAPDARFQGPDGQKTPTPGNIQSPTNTPAPIKGDASQTGAPHAAAMPDKTPQNQAESRTPATRTLANLSPSDKEELLYCACRCSTDCAAASSYSPKSVAGSASCEDVSGGPCVCSGFGCMRAPMNAECTAKCLKGMGIAFDAAAAKAFADDQNKSVGYPKPLVVKISPPGRATPAPGDNLALSATASGGNSPVTITWSGAASGTGDQVAFPVPSKTGPFTVTATAKDAAGQTATDALTLESSAAVLTLSQQSPAGATVPVGGKATFAAALTIGGKPAQASEYVIRYEPMTDVRFDKQEAAGLTMNTATFTRPGTFRVWAVAFARSGGNLHTVAESSPITITATAPAISLAASPANVPVGGQVTVTARETPGVLEKDAVYWWEDSQGGSGSGPAGNSKQWSFTVKGTKPVSVTAHLKSTVDNEELARQTLTVSPQGFTVDVVNLGPTFTGETARPQGDSPLQPNAVAPFADVTLRADIKPQPEHLPLRYSWTVNPGTTLSGGQSSKEVRIQRAEPGTMEASVEIFDASSISLGRASASVAVTPSTGGQAKPNSTLGASPSAASPQGEAKPLDRDARFKAIKEGAGKFAEKDYASAVAILETALAKGEQVFTLADGPVVEKAKTLLTKAKAELEKRKPSSQTQPDQSVPTERDGRLRSINTAAQIYADMNYAAAAAILEGALAGGDNVFTPADAPIVEKARTLLAKARELSRPTEAVPTSGNVLTPTTTGGKATTADNEKQSDMLFEQAKAKAAANNHADAIKDYKKVVALSPQACGAMNNLGASYESINDWESARIWYQKASNCDSNNQLFRDNLNNAKKSQPQSQPNTSQSAQCDALWDKAHAKGERGDSQGAIADYKRVLELCPKNCSAMNNIGAQLLDTLDNPAEAMPWFEKAHSCAPSNALYAKNVDKTQQLLKKGNTPKSNQCDTLWEKAHAKGDNGDPQGAIADYKRVLEMCPKNCSAMNNIGAQFLDNLNNPSEALPWFEKARACDPGDALFSQNVEKTQKRIQQTKALDALNTLAKGLGAAASAVQSQGAQPSPSPQAVGVDQYNGDYSGLFGGGTKGEVRLHIQNGHVAGQVYNNNLKAQVEGSVAPDGRIQCRLTGKIFGIPVTGGVGGYVRGRNAGGQWNAARNNGKDAEQGDWSASR